MEDELSPLFQYPPVRMNLVHDDKVSRISDSRFSEMLQSRQTFSKGLCEVYWGAVGSVARCKEVLEAGSSLLLLLEGIEDSWFFRFMMAISEFAKEICREEYKLDMFIKRADSFLGDYFHHVVSSNIVPQVSTMTHTLNYCLMACMNLLYRQPDVTKFGVLIRRVFLIMERERYWLDYLKTSLLLGFLTNYICQLIRRGCHTEIELVLGDAIGAGIAGLRHSVLTSNPQIITRVPFAPKDLSVASALLRNAFVVARPELLASILRPGNAILQKYRTADGATELIVHLCGLLQLTPDRHAVHCLCNLVHNAGWRNGLEEYFSGTNERYTEECFHLLDGLVRRENLPDNLKRTARVCLWGAKKVFISQDDIIYWSAAIGLTSTSFQGPEGEAVDNILVDTLNAQLDNQLSSSTDEDVKLIAERIRKMISDNVSRQLSVRGLNGSQQMESKAEIYSDLANGRMHQSSPETEEEDEPAFIFAREHAVLVSEVDAVPSFSPKWQHHKFYPQGDVASIESFLLEEAEMQGFVLIDLRVFVIGIFPRPHWPNVQPKKKLVDLDEKTMGVIKVDVKPTSNNQLLYKWSKLHPFDAFLYIRDGKKILICNHFGREIHLFLKFRKNDKKQV